MATTAWSTLYTTLTYNAYYSSDIIVSRAPASYQFSYSVAAATGYPTLYVMDSPNFSIWVRTSDPVPLTYIYGAFLPSTSTFSTALTLSSATTYPVVIYCGPYSTTISGSPTILSQNCSSLTVDVKWANIGVAAITSSSNNLPTSSSSPVPSASVAGGGTPAQGLSIGAVAGIAVAAFVIAGIIAAVVIVMIIRRRNRKSAATAAAPAATYPYAAAQPPPGGTYNSPYPPPQPGPHPYPQQQQQQQQQQHYSAMYSTAPTQAYGQQPQQQQPWYYNSTSTGDGSAPAPPHYGQPNPGYDPSNALAVSPTSTAAHLSASGSNALTVPQRGSEGGNDSRNSGQGIIMMKQ